MGRGPTKSNENAYFVARKKAAMYNERLYSREGAAELLGISVSTLADYELGNTKVVPVENYYSKEANKEYMSVSQYKDFAGTYGKMACEFSAIEKLEERWAQKKTAPLLVGSYVDSYFEGTLDEFKKANPEIFTQKGELKANYKQAERIIARMERDPLFMQYMSGEKQVIMTGELFGAEWKIKIDSFVRGIEFAADCIKDGH